MLKDLILEEWKNLFKNRDVIGKSAFESVKAKILVAEKSGNYTLPLDDAVVETIIVKEIKELEETRSFYKETDEKYSEFNYKINLLKKYLPQQLTEAEVKEIINKLKQQEPNMGKLIGLTVKEVGSRFDKSKIGLLVKEVLNG